VGSDVSQVALDQGAGLKGFHTGFKSQRRLGGEVEGGAHDRIAASINNILRYIQ
jgi:hypothetical protein